jgi:hypothetical protein
MQSKRRFVLLNNGKDSIKVSSIKDFEKTVEVDRITGQPWWALVIRKYDETEEYIFYDTEEKRDEDFLLINLALEEGGDIFN